MNTKKKRAEEFEALLKATTHDGVIDMQAWCHFILQCIEATATPKEWDNFDR